MSDTVIQGLVGQDSPKANAEGVHADLKINKRGELCVCDWYTEMALEGRVFQVRAGTITTPLTGDVDITDTKAEMCADVAKGITLLPIYLNVDLESFAGGTIPECAAKSASAVSTAGTAFIPLPFYSGGIASAATARVAAAGGVTVAAELATTTPRYFGSRATAMGDFVLADHEFRPPPVLAGPATFYVQVAAATAGPVYFANFDFIELPTVNVS